MVILLSSIYLSLLIMHRYIRKAVYLKPQNQGLVVQLPNEALLIITAAHTEVFMGENIHPHGLKPFSALFRSVSPPLKSLKWANGHARNPEITRSRSFPSNSISKRSNPTQRHSQQPSRFRAFEVFSSTGAWGRNFALDMH